MKVTKGNIKLWLSGWNGFPPEKLKKMSEAKYCIDSESFYYETEKELINEIYNRIEK